MSVPDSSRRRFLQSVSGSVLLAAAHRAPAAWMTRPEPGPATAAGHPFLSEGWDFTPVPASAEDRVVVPQGMEVEMLLRQGTVLNPSGDRYGDHNDYLALLPGPGDEGWAWCNHESVTLPVIAGVWKPPLTAEQAAACLQAMGGSAFRIRRDGTGRWRPVVPDPRNFRLDGLATRLRLTGPAAGSSWVGGVRSVTGSTSNCGGGITPWGTVCSGEENYQDIWGDFELGDQPLLALPVELVRPPEHYGWIVEVDLDRRTFFKHTALGRLAHENVAFRLTRDGRLAAYLGDDRDRQCLYKFVSRERFRPGGGRSNRRLLADGTLHVADTVRGRWLPLDTRVQPVLRRAGFDAARVCVHTRTAARLVGGTPLPRPEDVEVHPETGEVFVALTAWEPTPQQRKEKYFSAMAGALGRLREADGDAGAMEFAWDLLATSSVESGLAWPDNLAWTGDGQLLVTTDYAQKAKPEEKSPQALLGNNSLVVIPTQGPSAGRVRRLAVAPRGAEFCSPSLTPDGGELWVNVQHPGENSPGPDAWTSHWPDGGEAMPRSALVAIRRAG